MTTQHEANNAATNRTKEKVWFITGTSRGFGRIWATAALERGDKVVATARKLESIADLKDRFGSNVLTLSLDITNADQVKKAVTQAHQHFGRLDVVLNNAGYSLVGAIEEADAESVKALYETNVFGPLALIKAVLPLFRQQGHGHIVGVSSSLGHVTIPVIGYYCSSKWAFESIHESLAAEVKPFGINVTIVEPGAYATEFATQESLKFTQEMDVYRDFKAKAMEGIGEIKKGDPSATPSAIFKVVDAEQPPLRLILGSESLPWIRSVYEERLALWEEWKGVSNAAQGSPKVAEPATA